MLIRIGAAWLAVLTLLVASTAGAVFITTGDGTGNTTAPPDDPGFDHVGAKGTTGVYLGNRWVLTAEHADPTDIDFGGVVYSWIPGSEIQLTTQGQVADVLIYRLATAPPLAGVTLATSPPVVGESVVMVGRGINRAVNKTYWNGSWVEVTPPPPATFEGWKQSAGRTVRWGTNEISFVDLDVNAIGTLTREFTVDFDDLVDEGQAVEGDSGGAVFVKRAGNWQLLGIMNFVQTYSGQPSNAKVFGNRTYAIDVPYYLDQIQPLLAAGVPASTPWGKVTLGCLVAISGVAAAAGRPES